MLDELIDLILNRIDIANEEEFPRVNPRLQSYSFPKIILTEERIISNLNVKRTKKIRKNLLYHGKNNNELSYIHYFCPWYRLVSQYFHKMYSKRDIYLSKPLEFFRDLKRVI